MKTKLDAIAFKAQTHPGTGFKICMDYWILKFGQEVGGGGFCELHEQ